MKKSSKIIISILMFAFVLAGCNNADAEKKEDTQKKSMGTGTVKVDRKPIGGL